MIFSIVVGLVIYVLGYWLIGLPMARKGLEVWKRSYPTGSNGGFWGFILFPVMSSEGNVGSICQSTFLMSTIGSFDLFSCWENERLEAEHKYITASAAFWPSRIAFNLIAMAVMTVLGLLGLVLMAFIEGLPALASKAYKSVTGQRATTSS